MSASLRSRLSHLRDPHLADSRLSAASRNPTFFSRKPWAGSDEVATKKTARIAPARVGPTHPRWSALAGGGTRRGRPHQWSSRAPA